MMIEIGRKNIYANIGHTRAVFNVTENESNELLGYLYNQVDNPKYLYIHQWKQDDALLWDNRGEILMMMMMMILMIFLMISMMLMKLISEMSPLL